MSGGDEVDVKMSRDLDLDVQLENYIADIDDIIVNNNNHYNNNNRNTKTTLC